MQPTSDIPDLLRPATLPPQLMPGLRAVMAAQADNLAAPAPALAAPNMASMPMPALSSAPMPSAAPSPALGHLNELYRQQATGDGISQIQNPLLRGLARTADIAASVFGPTRALAYAIPGTAEHHAVTMHQAMENVAQDAQQQQSAAQLAQMQAGTLHMQAATRLTNDQANAAEAPAGPQYEYQKTPQGLVAIERGTTNFHPVTGPDGTPLTGDADTLAQQHANAVADALQRGVDPSKDSKVGELSDAITGLQRQPTPKEPNKDDRAISIMAKPSNQRTPEEVSYLSGYDQYVQKNKIAPAAVRVSAMMQMPQAIVDPTDPTHTRIVYTNKRGAMGMEAPQSGDARAASRLLTDFTSGADAKTLTNINTADAHIAQLRNISQALHNGNIQLANQLGNSYATATGSAPPLNFQLLKTALAGEIGKTVTGSVATVEETKEISKALSAANSPEQLYGVTSQAHELMNSKRDQLHNQFTQGQQGKPNFGGGGASGPRVNDIEDGHRFTGGNPADPKNWVKQ